MRIQGPPAARRDASPYLIQGNAKPPLEPPQTLGPLAAQRDAPPYLIQVRALFSTGPRWLLRRLLKTIALLLLGGGFPFASAHFADEGRTLQCIDLQLQEGALQLTFQLRCDAAITAASLDAEAKSLSAAGLDDEIEDQQSVMEALLEVRLGNPLQAIEANPAREKIDRDGDKQLSLEECRQYLAGSSVAQYDLFGDDDPIAGKTIAWNQRILKNKQGKHEMLLELVRVYPLPKHYSSPSTLKVETTLSKTESASVFILSKGAKAIHSDTIQPAARPVDPLTESFPEHSIRQRRVLLHLKTAPKIIP